MSLLRTLLAAMVLSAVAYGQRQFSGDAAELRLSLEKLNVTGSVLMIGAHPDDENTAVLAYFARGRKVRTAYLALNRGEGGQNFIGSEQGIDIGLIRTQELLAARRIDGAEQFFTRSIDFGFSKTAEETLQKWGHDQVLSDVVWVIRKYQPDVIINRFSGTPRDGHGNHQVSAILSKEAFRAAADPNRFPEQLAYVKPWQAKREVWNVFSFTKEQEEEAKKIQSKVTVDTGEYNPLLGRSYNEIAGMSRSQHRSQAMGSGEIKGSSLNSFALVEGEPMKTSLFDGIDTTWNRVEHGASVGKLIEKALAEFNPEHPEKIVPTLLEARKLLRAIQSPIAERKLQELDEVILRCTGTWLEATAAKFSTTPGSTINVTLSAIVRTPATVTYAPLGVALTGRSQNSADHEALKPLPFNKPQTKEFATPVPADTPISQPYWLREPPSSGMYVVRDQQLIGMPQDPPVLTASFALSFEGEEIVYTRPVIFRYVDPGEGEQARPFIVAPPVTVEAAERSLVFPAPESRQIEISISAANVVSPRVALKIPNGWKAEPKQQETKLTAGETRTASFTLTPPAGEADAHMTVEAMLDGKIYSRGMKVIRYPHIPPIVTFPEQTVRLVREDVKVLSKRVGYIMGAGDEVPDALRQIGCEVTLLTSDELEHGDLNKYDAIVAGVRAYNVRPDLKANQARLLAYMQNGGTYVMQYNVVEGGMQTQAKTETRVGPYPLKLSRDRVTVEEAPVSIISPQNPLLREPNPISPKDFKGWVQERGLYFPNEWDDRYQPLLESHDPNEKELKGGVLVTRVGKGAYVYTGYAFFRQLPAGVPGAYRLFANFLSAGKTMSEGR